MLNFYNYFTEIKDIIEQILNGKSIHLNNKFILDSIILFFIMSLLCLFIFIYLSKRYNLNKILNGGNKCNYNCKYVNTNKNRFKANGENSKIYEYKCKSKQKECSDIEVDPSFYCSNNYFQEDINLELDNKYITNDEFCCKINNDYCFTNYLIN